MIITTSGWILIVAISVLLASGGGLASSLLNHRKLDHMYRNMRAMRQAQDALEAKGLEAAREIKQALETQQAKNEQGVGDVKQALETQQAKNEREVGDVKQALEIQQAKNERGVEDVKQALAVQQAKNDVRSAGPTDVTIVNNAAQPVPVEDVNGGEDRSERQG